MDFLSYHKLQVRKKLLQIVSLQMKLKKHLMSQKSIKEFNEYQMDYYLLQTLNKLKELKKRLNKIR